MTRVEADGRFEAAESSTRHVVSVVVSFETFLSAA
jgi:hypothetical protein